MCKFTAIPERTGHSLITHLMFSGCFALPGIELSPQDTKISKKKKKKKKPSSQVAPSRTEEVTLSIDKFVCYGEIRGTAEP